MRLTCGILLSLVFAGVAGCAAKSAHIAYPVDDVPRFGGGPLAQMSLVVEPPTDGRSDVARARRTDGLSPAMVQQSGDDWYANSDDIYDEPSVAQGVAEAIADHLRAAELFRSVAVGGPETPGDLHLSATMVRFDALQDRQEGTRAFAAQGGLLPLLVAANTDTRYEAAVRLENVRLVRSGCGWAVPGGGGP
jgi:hypothetical protein